MKLITLWITRTYGDDPPEMVEAWDEGNYPGMQESFEKAKASIGTDLAQWRIVEIEVPGDEIEAASRPLVVKRVILVDN